MYEAARHRLQDKQDARLSRVMQQWQEAQRQYEELKKKDPQGANVMQEAMLTVSTSVKFLRHFDYRLYQKVYSPIFRVFR